MNFGMVIRKDVLGNLVQSLPCVFLFSKMHTSLSHSSAGEAFHVWSELSGQSGSVVEKDEKPGPLEGTHGRWHQQVVSCGELGEV